MKYCTISQPGGPDVLVMTECPTPKCGDDEVLIKVSAAGVNRPDVMQRMGLYPPPQNASPILGLEVAGIISKVGKNVSQWGVGDAVCALCNGGGYAQTVNVPAGQCLAIPDGLSMIEAASLPETYFTAWSNLINLGRLKAGESLLVHGGSSGIGVAAIQIAKSIGVTVYTTAGSKEKCQACENLGADMVINYKNQDFVGLVKQATNARGVDVVLDMVGGDYIEKNMAVARMDGRIVNIAFQHGFEQTVNFLPLMLKRLCLTGSMLRPQSHAQKAAIADALTKNIWPKLASGDIKAVVHKVFNLEDARLAHQLMESSEHIGKIVLNVT